MLEELLPISALPIIARFEDVNLTCFWLDSLRTGLFSSSLKLGKDEVDVAKKGAEHFFVADVEVEGTWSSVCWR